MNQFTTNASKPDRSVVRAAAYTLMLANKTTTTLEVKNFLRHQGYLAFQNEISPMMDRLAHEEGWIFHFNGNFRIYTFEDDEVAKEISCDVLGFSSN